tara:strand:- start:237 stop:509 length:273 start_codon:yes stop_codon:yes gene_type:complete
MANVTSLFANKPHIVRANTVDDHMVVVAISAATGEKHAMPLAITEAQVYDWAKGASIQDAMPDLSPEGREFLMTGITQGEWDSMFSDSEE